MKETEVTIGGKDNLSGITRVSNLSEPGPRPPEEEVDGVETTRALRSLQKLTFLKIILVDIGISLGDVVTDVVQGMSLIFEANWGIASTSHYGVLVLLTCWLPGPLTLLHLCVHHRGLTWSPIDGVPTLFLALVSLLLFPLVPTLLYVCVLLSQTPSYWEKKAREVKAITGVTESPIQIILLGFLMLKGILVFPWSEEVSNSCIEDELGRRLCLPSIPMVSITFSLASILKAMYDMNLYPLLRDKISSDCANLLLTKTPFYLANVIFRLCSYSFIATFLDLWSLIPLGILFFSNLCICGLFFTPPLLEESSTEDPDSREDNNDEIESGGQYETDSIGWNKNIVILSPRRENRDIVEPNKPQDLVNEENTPIFLNAVAGLFFPICYSEASTHTASDSLSHLLAWQARFLQVHILVFNTLLLVVVSTIYVLVSFVPSFNYNYNVMDFFWFKTACAFLGLMGVMSLTMSLDTELSNLAARIFEWFGGRQRRDSGREDLWRKTYICLLASLLVSLPAIIGLVFFHTSPPPRPLLLVAKEVGVANRELHAIGASVPTYFDYSPNSQLIEGHITNICNASHAIQTKILLLNMTDPLCRQLVSDEQALTTLLVGKHLAVVVLDSADAPGWRVSSPYRELEVLARVLPEANLLLVRKQDWAGLEKQLVTGAKLTISRDSDFDMEDLNMFPCSIESPLRLEVKNENQKGGKTLLHKDGRITQEVTVPVHCSSFGALSSCKKWNIQDTMTWRAECKNIRNVDVELFDSDKGHSISSLDIVLRNNETSSICCQNSHTFLKAFSTDNQLLESIFLKNLTECNFSDFIDESCKREYGLLTRSRFCINKNLVIKEYTKVLCANNATIQNSCDVTYDC